jgi:hypothetical protein
MPDFAVRKPFLAAPFEKLHGTLVLLGCVARVKRAQVPTLASFRV